MALNRLAFNNEMCGLLWRTLYKSIKKFWRKKIFYGQNQSKSTYNPLLQVDYPLFQKSVSIGFVLLSIHTTMQNL